MADYALLAAHIARVVRRDRRIAPVKLAPHRLGLVPESASCRLLRCGASADDEPAIVRGGAHTTHGGILHWTNAALSSEALGASLPEPVHRAVRKRLVGAGAADASGLHPAHQFVLVLDTFKSTRGPLLCAEFYDISISEGTRLVPFSIV